MLKLLVVAVVLMCFFYGLKFHTDKLYQVMCKWLEASQVLHEWRHSHPYIYLGLSDVGKALLVQAIEAYDQFVRYHPYVRDDEYREWLLSLFNDLPPPRRKPRPIKKRPWALFSLYPCLLSPFIVE